MGNPIKDAGEGIEQAADGISRLIEVLKKVPRLAIICLLLGDNGYQRYCRDKVQAEYTKDLKQSLIIVESSNRDKDRIIGLQDTLHNNQQTIKDQQAEINQLIRENRHK